MSGKLQQQLALVERFEHEKTKRKQEPAYKQRHIELRQQEVLQQRQLLEEFERRQQREFPVDVDMVQQCQLLEEFERMQSIREQNPAYKQRQAELQQQELQQQEQLLQEFEDNIIKMRQQKLLEEILEELKNCPEDEDEDDDAPLSEEDQELFDLLIPLLECSRQK